MTKLRFCFVLISLILIGTFSRVNAQGRAIMLPYGSEPQLEWIPARNLSEQEAPDLWVFQGSFGGFDRVYWDLSTYTFYLIEQYPGEVFTTQWYVNIDYLTDFQLFVGSMPLILESYGWTEPDFSYQDAAYATEQTAWDSFIAANDALIAQRISEDNAAAMQRAREIVASGRPVQINYDDGTTEIRLPDGSTKTFDNPNGLKVVVPVYADGYKFEGIGLSQSAVNILNDPARKITSYAQAESQASIDATFAQTARSVADANNALFDLWLKRDMALGSIGDPTALEGYIGAGPFGHSFDGWLDWDYETGAWNTSQLIEMFLAELPYQVPVFNIGYKVGTAALPYTFFVPYEDYGSTAQDPFTGNPLSSGGLLLEAGIDAGALIVTYRIIPPAYSFGSYADDLVLAELRAFSAGTTSLRVATPYGLAVQAESAAALAARSQVQGGATLYRVGTLGKSAAGEAQFWALENPLNPGFAARHGIPPGNIVAADFIETATLRPGAPFVTRVAPGVGGNGGGAIEVVVESGGVSLQTFSTGTPRSP